MFKLCITGDLGFELWKDIPGYEGYYKISTYGNIFGVKRGKLLSQFSDKRGYMRVNLCKNGKTLNPCVYDMYIQHLFSCMLNCPLCFLSQF